MAKKFNFDKKMENDANNVIEEILQADFPLPEQAEAAKKRLSEKPKRPRKRKIKPFPLLKGCVSGNKPEIK